MAHQSSICGLWYPISTPGAWPRVQRSYLPMTRVKSHSTILAAASRTVLTQSFVNRSEQTIDEIHYSFPLYDGVSVVAFTCTVGEKKIVGRVKQKDQARQDYEEAKGRGETAGLLAQLPQASDVFSTKIGNVPARAKVDIEIVYLGELKHDGGVDGLRFTIPTVIAPRYGTNPQELGHTMSSATTVSEGIEFVVDVVTDEASPIRQIQSPSHPISVTIGRTSTDQNEEAFESNRGSASLALNDTVLESDFVVLVLAKDADVPKAFLETHPTIPQHRCLMTTLVPKFTIPQANPEIVFVVDRSGSMAGTKILTVVRALNLLLKSLPIGVKFNVCSFGSRHDFLWSQSKTYNKTNLDEAVAHVNTIMADYGGTEMLQPIKATVKSRFKDMQLEVIVLTDGEIWNQQELFDFITNSSTEHPIRFFSLGIGSGASSSLVEGIASAGQGFSQFVAEDEKLEKKMIRLLKGALTPRVTDYSLEIKYARENDDDFELISIAETLTIDVKDDSKSEKSPKRSIISLFDRSAEKEEEKRPSGPIDRYAHLPKIPIPAMIQAPHRIPSLFPFNRTTIFIMLGPEANQRLPKSVVLRGTSKHGPLELGIEIQDVGQGTMLHQLAAKKAMQELEQGRGWLLDAKNKDTKPLKDLYPGRWDEIVEREAVRLGVSHNISGKFCAFVALQSHSSNDNDKSKEEAVEGRMAAADAELEGPDRISSSSCDVSYFSSPPMAKRASKGMGGMFFGFGRPMARGGGGVQLNAAAPPPPPAAPAPASAFAPASALASTMRARKLKAAAFPPSTGAQVFGSVRNSQAVPSEETPFGAAPGGSVVPPVAAQPRQMQQAQLHQCQEHLGLPQQDSERRKELSAVPQQSYALAKKSSLSEYDGAKISTLGGALSSNRIQSTQADKRPFSFGSEQKVASVSTATITDENRMHSLIGLQNFDGSWDYTQQLADLLLVDFSMELALANKTDLTTTAIAIAFFKVIVPEEEAAWELVVEKALGWLGGKLGNRSHAEEEVEKCKDILRRAFGKN